MRTRLQSEVTSLAYVSWSVICLVVGVVGLFALNFSNFMRRLDGGDISVASQLYASSISQQFDKAISSLNAIPHGADIAVLLFWALTGMVVYVLFVALASTWGAARDESAMMQYRLPAFAEKTSLIRTILVHWVLLFIVAFLSVVFAGLLAFVGIPFCRDLFAFGIYGVPELTAVMQIVSASLLMTLGLMTEGFLLFITKRLFSAL